MKDKKTAIVLGATGLVGAVLLEKLLSSAEYDKVVTFTRRALEEKHEKLINHVVDFDAMHDWKDKVVGDVVFCAFGTTLKTAGSKEKQYKIDYTYQFDFASIAAQNKVDTLVLISSAGANDKSNVFYTRIKGELDAAVQELPFKQVYILRPSILKGSRSEKRMGEKISITLMDFFAAIGVFKKYRPIHVSVVAEAMMNALKLTNSNVRMIFELEEVWGLTHNK